MRFLWISFSISLLLLLGFGLILREWNKAAVVCSLLLVMFFSYGQLANMIQESPLASLVENHPTAMAFAWLGLFLLLLFFILRADISSRTTAYLNLSAFVLLLLPLLTILVHSYISFRGDQSHVPELAQIRGDDRALAGTDLVEPEKVPDIYYIVFDGYLRADKLDELYGYDNSEFLRGLRQRGFFVAEKSRSNYLNTTYSLNTSLNLVYFHEFPKRIIPTARYNLKTNFLSDFLRDRGYEVIVFDSGTGDTNYQYADRFMTPHRDDVSTEGGFNQFEQLMLRTTLGAFLFNNDEADANSDAQNQVAASMEAQLDRGRERIEFTIEGFPKVASSDKAHFVFAHIYLPHIPFLYGPDGEDLAFRDDLHLSWYQLQHDDYAEYYGYQLDYLNEAILVAIDEVMATSVDPYVIVLQSDHGDDLHLDWANPSADGVDVRSAIFYSIIYSDGSYEDYYPSISPVNTFRVVLNNWFGAEYPVLTDEVYYHEHPLMTPFYRIPKFRNACADFGLCPSQ